MLSKNEVKNSIINVLGILVFTVVSVFFASCDETEDALTNTVCQDVGLDCSKSPFEYKACADGTGSAWWELNGTKYYDVNSATEAYFNYCD